VFFTSSEKNLPKTHSWNSVNGNNDNDNEDNTHDEFIEISCFGTKVSINKKSASSRRHVDSNNTIMELWYSHENILLSEAACLKCTKHVMSNDHNQVTTTSNDQVCATRIDSNQYKVDTTII
jgi:hypothetical protein